MCQKSDVYCDMYQARIWCPMCGKTKLTRYYDPPTNGTGFTCSLCGHMASSPYQQLWSGINSPRSILGRQLVYLTDYYRQAIYNDVAGCIGCGQITRVMISCPDEIPEEVSLLSGPPFHGIHTICSNCRREEFNPLSHLALDTPEAQLFWRKHPRMQWLPTREIEYANQPALLTGFQSLTDAARLDIIYQRETLRVFDARQDIR